MHIILGGACVLCQQGDVSVHDIHEPQHKFDVLIALMSTNVSRH